MDSTLLLNYSTEELQGMRKKHEKTPAIVKVLDEELTRRAGEADKAKATFEAMAKVEESKAKYIDLVNKAFAKVPEPPEGEARWLHLVYDEMEDTTQPQVEVTLIDTPAVVDKEGKVTVPAVTHVEKRYPKVTKWHVAPFITQVTTTKQDKTSNSPKKRAETVRFVTQDNKVVVMGNFATGADACKLLGLDAGVSSANKVLEDKGFILTPYDGTTFTTILASEAQAILATIKK